MDLSDVLQRVLAGDRQAYAMVVRQFEKPLFAFLGRMGLSRAVAEEVAQESLLRAWTRLADFDPGRGSFPTWLYTIARRLALSELSRAAGRREVGTDSASDFACARPEPAESLQGDERRRRLRTALLKLPAADRTVLALAYLEELSHAEIAGIEGIAVGAVKTRLHRARRRLAAQLDQGDDQ